MGGFLEKILNHVAAPEVKKPLPARRTGKQAVSARPGKSATHVSKGLPNATLVYGIGACLLFVDSIGLLLYGRWVAGLAIFVIGACLAGFGWHMYKHQD